MVVMAITIKRNDNTNKIMIAITIKIINDDNNINDNYKICNKILIIEMVIIIITIIVVMLIMIM